MLAWGLQRGTFGRVSHLRTPHGRIALAIFVAGIVGAILLPTTHWDTCSQNPTSIIDGCNFFSDPHLLARFALAISFALPLAALFAGLSLRRWMAMAGAVLIPAGIALAVVLPSSMCPDMVDAAFCAPPERAWTRFLVVLFAVILGTTLLARSGLLRNRAMTVAFAALGSIAVAFFLPSADGSPLLIHDASLTDHRIGWRLLIIVAACLVSALDRGNAPEPAQMP